MNSNFFKQSSVVLSIATLTVALSGVSAQAETTNSKVAEKKDNRVSTSASLLQSKPSASVVAQAQPTYPGTVTPTTPSTEPAYPGTTTPTTPSTEPAYPGTTTPTTPSTEPAYPGTTTPTTPSTEPAYPGTTTPTQETTPTEPSSGIQPGRATRGGSSYLGIGGNIGVTGDDTALSEFNFTVLSKIGITNAVSVRPSAVIGDNTTILIPVTYDFSTRPTPTDVGPISSFAPYIGGGLGITTGDNSDVGPMLTAGVDVPLNNQFTATAGLNAGFFDDVSLGVAIGVGYNFGGF